MKKKKRNTHRTNKHPLSCDPDSYCLLDTDDVRSIQLWTTAVGINSRDAWSELGCSATYRSANATKSFAIFMAIALLSAAAGAAVEAAAARGTAPGTDPAGAKGFVVASTAMPTSRSCVSLPGLETLYIADGLDVEMAPRGTHDTADGFVLRWSEGAKARKSRATCVSGKGTAPVRKTMTYEFSVHPGTRYTQCSASVTVLGVNTGVSPLTITPNAFIHSCSVFFFPPCS